MLVTCDVCGQRYQPLIGNPGGYNGHSCPGPGEPTLREALITAHEGVGRAVEHRRELLREARRRGVTLRTLADVIGVSFNTIKRWSDGDESINGRTAQQNVLDAPASANAKSRNLPGEDPT